MLAESYSDLTSALDEPYEHPRRGGTPVSASGAGRRADMKRDATHVLAYGEEANRLATADDDESRVTVGSGVFRLGTAAAAANATAAAGDQNDLDRAADERLALLARRQEGASREDRARYLLLTERLRRLDPRFTEADHESISRAVDTLERASDLLASVSARFGV